MILVLHPVLILLSKMITPAPNVWLIVPLVSMLTLVLLVLLLRFFKTHYVLIPVKTDTMLIHLMFVKFVTLLVLPAKMEPKTSVEVVMKDSYWKVLNVHLDVLMANIYQKVNALIVMITALYVKDLNHVLNVRVTTSNKLVFVLLHVALDTI